MKKHKQVDFWIAKRLYLICNVKFDSPASWSFSYLHEKLGEKMPKLTEALKEKLI